MKLLRLTALQRIELIGLGMIDALAGFVVTSRTDFVMAAASDWLRAFSPIQSNINNNVRWCQDRTIILTRCRCFYRFRIFLLGSQRLRMWTCAYITVNHWLMASNTQRRRKARVAAVVLAAAAVAWAIVGCGAVLSDWPRIRRGRPASIVYSMRRSFACVRQIGRSWTVVLIVGWTTCD